MVNRHLNKHTDLLEDNATDEARHAPPDITSEIRSISSDLAKSINSHGWKMAILIATIIVMFCLIIN